MKYSDKMEIYYNLSVCNSFFIEPKTNGNPNAWFNQNLEIRNALLSKPHNRKAISEELRTLKTFSAIPADSDFGSAVFFMLSTLCQLSDENHISDMIGLMFWKEFFGRVQPMSMILDFFKKCERDMRIISALNAAENKIITQGRFFVDNEEFYHPGTITILHGIKEVKLLQGA